MKKSKLSSLALFNKSIKYTIYLPLVVATSAVLSACGGSSDDSSDVSPTTTGFSLAVSDAPVDSASEVVVVFDEVELTGDGAPIRFDVQDENGDPRSIDLLTLPGSQFETIVAETAIPTGAYSQLRLSVTSDSYIVTEEGTFPIRVPSGELKLDGFTAQPGFDAAYTVEFDLRKSLVDPVGQPVIMLKPRGVRLVLNDDVGTLEGSIAPTLLDDEQCASKMDLFTGNAVYLYEGEQSSINSLGDDADEGADDSEVRPFAIVPVTYDDVTQAYNFTAGFVPQGEYTASFSCSALFDEPETDEDEVDGFSLQTLDITTVVAGETTTLDIE